MKLEEILKKHEYKRDRLLEIIHDMDDENINYHDLENLKILSKRLKTTIADIYGTITFYGMIRDEKRTRFEINFCSSTVCHIKKAKDLILFVEKLLNCDENGISSDGLFKINRVECLGLCNIAPAMTINGKVYGNLTKEKIENIIRELKNESNS
ncbi:complex I 24 kDa subunit family protein [Hippea alviniae]|uniref:NADH-quinone oxidoreductase subunit NuoE family protein n=1 Tax=Hippea alviniae TaxID=1279027 RepID=UPI0003B6163A|nr:NAD(P)H-dependent oxidoreductase subunit E [Hippea alviniae]